jgi:CBS domain-containing protein
MKVRDLMTRPPLTIDEHDDVALGLQIMAWGDVRHLPVLRDGALAGVGTLPVVDDGETIVGTLSYVDVLRALLESRSGTAPSSRA